MECATPFTIRSKSLAETIKFGRTRKVPCGKCPACIDRKRNEWIFRVKQELRNSYNAFFITLTYDNLDLPLNKFGYPTFSKRHIQLFMKKFRFYVSKYDSTLTVRHFICGEYGSQFGRPHYHGILFNCPPLFETWRLVQKSWFDSRISVSKCTGARIGYVINYMYGRSDLPDYEVDQTNRPLFLCSKKPGIGFSYCLDAQVVNYHKQHISDCFGRVDGRNYVLPRYYVDKIYNDNEKTMLRINKQMAVDEMINARFERERVYRERNPDYNVPGWYTQEVAQYYSNFYKRVKKHKVSNYESI